MTKNPFDQFSKQVFQAFLKPYGEVRTNFEVPGEPRFIDVLFTPSQDVSAIPESMGLMRHMASKACLIEPFRNQPRPKEILKSILQCHTERSEVSQYMPVIRRISRRETLDSSLRQMLRITSLRMTILYLTGLFKQPLSIIAI